MAKANTMNAMQSYMVHVMYHFYDQFSINIKIIKKLFFIKVLLQTNNYTLFQISLFIKLLNKTQNIGV